MNCMMASVLSLPLLFLGSFSNASTLKPIASFDLPGPGGLRFDYLTIDYKHNYLLSAHLGAGLLYVINIADNSLIKAIPDVPGIEGVEFIPELDKVYASNAGNNKVAVVDLKQMKVIKNIPAENKPDGSVYAEGFGKIYVSDERAKSLLVIDVYKDEIVKTLRFEGRTGMPQFDRVSKMVYVNLQDQNMFAVIDPRDDSVVEKILVEPCHMNHGMVIDPSNRRAFLACQDNDLLAVMDLSTFKIITTVPLPKGVDVLKFDPGLDRIYAACSSGAISVIQQVNPNQYKKLEDFPVQAKVHSLEIDLRTHRVYAPEQEEDGKPVSRMIVYDAVMSKMKKKSDERQLN